MKILHTADWHLGRKTDDLDRFTEQKSALNQIIDIANTEKVDLVLIAGDIYDSLIPSSEAERVFYNTLISLSRNGDCAVVVIAGNHDDPKRLSNANIFSDKFNIFLVGYIDEINVSKPNFEKNIYCTECGTGYIKFHLQNGEDCVVDCLPYPTYYRYRENKIDNRPFSEKIYEWLNIGAQHFSDSTINIILAHLTTIGDNLSAGDLKTYNYITNTTDANLPVKMYPLADYIALGHVHQHMKLNKAGNMFYSGSLINQFFYEGDQPTSVIVADVKKSGIENLQRKFLDVKLLQKFVVESVEEAENVLKHLKDFLLKIEIRNVDFVDIEDVRMLRKNYPNLVTLSIITREGEKDYIVESKKDLTYGEIFDKFVDYKNADKDNDVKELFLELMNEDIFRQSGE